MKENLFFLPVNFSSFRENIGYLLATHSVGNKPTNYTIMKAIVRFFILICFVMGAMHNSYGQDKLDPVIVSDLKATKQYAFGVSQELHFRGVLGMYDRLVDSGVPITDYEIVVKGKVVKQLVKGSELETLFQKYKGKVRVSVCSVAMGKLGVTEDQLIDGMEPVVTYSIRLLQLQAKGYSILFY